MHEVDPSTLPPDIAREHQAYRLRDAATFLLMAADFQRNAGEFPQSASSFALMEKEALYFANLNMRRARKLGKRAEEK